MQDRPPLSLYIHIPWCARKCPYCDFNSHVCNGPLPERAYVAALLADLEDEWARVGDHTVGSIFIGGGTPSLFSAAAIAALLQGVRERVTLATTAEITLEANPGSAEAGKFQGFREAGVNRLSIGVQSFDAEHLRRIGRIHGPDEALQAVGLARAAGFDNINLDLMFGLPEQTVEEAVRDVRTAISLEPSHLSLYQFTLEPNTWFHKYPPALPDEAVIFEAQQACQNLLATAAYPQYEVSAYAREGRRCWHNLNYWRYGDYLGIGAGAHGKLTDPATGTIVRNWKICHPAHYLAAGERAVRSGGSARVEPDAVPFEFLMNALRLREGFRNQDFQARTGRSLEVLEPVLSSCLADGLLEREGDRVRCSETGYLFLDDILQRFLPP